mmetsp:Transcript_38836/g.123475  ORF Transcript_38836/g.123475 Transcript_38836/m.123475 type:complete len:220 (-) Transcript_38836:797-1456(-)
MRLVTRSRMMRWRRDSSVWKCHVLKAMDMLRLMKAPTAFWSMRRCLRASSHSASHLLKAAARVRFMNASAARRMCPLRSCMSAMLSHHASNAAARFFLAMRRTMRPAFTRSTFCLAACSCQSANPRCSMRLSMCPMTLVAMALPSRSISVASAHPWKAASSSRSFILERHRATMARWRRATPVPSFHVPNDSARSSLRMRAMIRSARLNASTRAAAWAL